MNRSKVIGYFAQFSGSDEMYCDGDALIVCGAKRALKARLEKYYPNSGKYIVHAARLGDILDAMKLFGAAYAFDRLAYSKQCPQFEEIIEASGCSELPEFKDGSALFVVTPKKTVDPSKN